jgi:hypothetical protein
MAASAPQAIDLPGDRLFPESVSIAPNGTAYVASLTGGVLRVNLATRKVEPWIKPGAFGSGALFGVLADTRNKLVWTCTNDFTARGVTVAGAEPGSWLKGFDIATGEGKVSLALPDKGAICNDMAVGRDGSVYVADTGHPRILRWAAMAASMVSPLAATATSTSTMSAPAPSIAWRWGKPARRVPSPSWRRRDRSSRRMACGRSVASASCWQRVRVATCPGSPSRATRLK